MLIVYNTSTAYKSYYPILPCCQLYLARPAPSPVSRSNAPGGQPVSLSSCQGEFSGPRLERLLAKRGGQG